MWSQFVPLDLAPHGEDKDKGFGLHHKYITRLGHSCPILGIFIIKIDLDISFEQITAMKRNAVKKTVEN